MRIDEIVAMREELKTLSAGNLDEAKFEGRQSRTLSETLDGILRWLQKDLVASYTMQFESPQLE